jgi:hypothetical protein
MALQLLCKKCRSYGPGNKRGGCGGGGSSNIETWAVSEGKNELVEWFKMMVSNVIDVLESKRNVIVLGLIIIWT